MTRVRNRVALTGKKRAAKEAEDNASDTSEQERNESSESEQEEDKDKKDKDYQPTSKTKRRRTTKSTTQKSTSAKSKTAPAKTRKTRTSKLNTGKAVVKTSKKKTSSSAKSTGKRKQRTEEDLEEAEQHPIVKGEDKKSLFAIVRSEGASIGLAVDEWIKRYEENQLEGIAELITFLLHASGCIKAKFTEKEVEEEDLGDIIQDLYNKFEKTKDYPIVSKHISFKKFNGNFAEFLNTLISNSKDTILYDNFMLKYLITWLNALSSSNVRAFRHTATLAVYQVVDSIIIVVDSLKTELKAAQKQLKAAKKNKNKSRETDLQKECDTIQERIETLEEYINNTCESVFVHRAMDTIPDIRALSMVSLGHWIIAHPDFFLADKYVKYLGWLLSDKDAQVRETTIKALAKLYTNEEWLSQLSKFTNKFLPRIVEMTSDVNIAVADEAIKLLTVLLKYEILQEHKNSKEFIQEISTLVFDQNSSVRHYAAKFVFSNLAKKIKKSKKKGEKSTKRTKATDISLEDLLEFIRNQSKEMPSVGSLMVDAFWSLSDTFKKWDEITTLLIEKADELEEQDSLNLIRILNASVKKLCNKLDTVTSAQDTVKVPKAKKRAKEDEDKDIGEMTSALAKALPQLLTKYATEKEAVEELLEIPQHFMLEAYTEHHLQDEFEELLNLLKDMFWKHTEPRIFKSCASTFKHLVAEQYSLQSKAQTAYDELVREMVTRLRAAIGTQSEGGAESHNYEILVGLQRIEQFIQFVDINVTDFFKFLSELIDARNKGATDLTTDACISILTIINIYFTWRMKDITQKKEVQSADVVSLGKSSKQYIVQLVTMLDDEKFNVAKAAFFNLADLTLLMNPALLAKNTELSPLKLEFSAEVRDAIKDFVEKALKTYSEDEENEKPVHNDIQKFVAAAAKLMAFGDLYGSLATPILADYLNHGAEMIEAVKYLYSKIKQHSAANLVTYEFQALERNYAHYVTTKEKSDFSHYVDLADRFAKHHFPGKDTKSVSEILLTAIQYICDKFEQNYEMFVGLQKYVNKLDTQAATTVLENLEEAISSNSINLKGEKWEETVKKFIDALKQVIKGKKKSGDDDEEEEPQASTSTPARRKRNRVSLSSPEPSAAGEAAEEQDKTGTKRGREEMETSQSEGEAEKEDAAGKSTQEEEELEDEDLISETPSKKQRTDL